MIVPIYEKFIELACFGKTDDIINAKFLDNSKLTLAEQGCIKYWAIPELHKVESVILYEINDILMDIYKKQIKGTLLKQKIAELYVYVLKTSKNVFPDISLNSTIFCEISEDVIDNIIKEASKKFSYFSFYKISLNHTYKKLFYGIKELTNNLCKNILKTIKSFFFFLQVPISLIIAIFIPVICLFNFQFETNAYRKLKVYEEIKQMINKE